MELGRSEKGKKVKDIGYLFEGEGVDLDRNGVWREEGLDYDL